MPVTTIYRGRKCARKEMKNREVSLPARLRLLPTTDGERSSSFYEWVARSACMFRAYAFLIYCATFQRFWVEDAMGGLRQCGVARCS